MIRGATVDDLPALAALESRLFGSDSWSEMQLSEELTGPGRRMTVSQQDGTIIGYAVTMTLGDVVDLQRIAVRPEHRRRGTARALLEEATAVAEAAGADRVLLEVSAANAGAMAFYAEAGFTEIDRRPRYYRDGSDAVVLRRSLARGCGWG